MAKNPKKEESPKPASTKTTKPRHSYEAAYVYSIDQILERRDDLFDELVGDLVGKQLDNHRFDRMVKIVNHHLPADVHHTSVYMSLQHFYGVTLTEEAAFETAWLFMGNVARFKAARLVVAWKFQPFPEWCPVQIVGARPQRNPKSLGFEFQLRFVAGLPCPKVVRKYWSNAYVHMLAPEFGFVSGRAAELGSEAHGLVFEDGEQFVGLRFYAKVEPELSQTEPGFKHICFPPGVHRWNVEQHKYRLRQGEKYACPHGMPEVLPCHRCPYGFLDCRAATHRATYQTKPCKCCKKDQAPWDPERPTARVCVNCERNDAFKRRTE